ncbi:MAG: hypothetical protein GY773_09255, partial [Actinomycetia bacterium]|nr:hypothetical protein [Actinomycetes bacterium]
ENEASNEDENEVSNEDENEVSNEDENEVEPQPASDENGRDEPDADEEKVGVLELRQIAGLTAGVVMDLVQSSYDFAEGTDVVGFSIRVDDHDRAVVVPGAAPARLDSIAINEPTPIGSGVLDVGTARFIIRPKKERRRATDWLDETTRIDQPEPVIVVPSNMTEPAPAPGRRRGLRRRKQPPTDQASDVATWEFIESIRQTRAEMADRERYHYPDPADLVIRAAHEAPNLGVRPPGHPLFAKIGVMVADQHWLPNFDNIQDIPESIGTQIQPLLSLPSVPVVADLLVGPLGIVGTRAAAMAAARHIMVSLFGLSTQDLHLHIASSEVRADAWQWARTISSDQPVDTDDGFPVVIVDGMENFGVGGFSHQEALNHEVGVVILVDSVEDLPSYCGTVLQIDPAGTALLTNHLGNVIKGTPIGISTATAASIASDLLHVLTPRRSE